MNRDLVGGRRRSCDGLVLDAAGTEFKGIPIAVSLHRRACLRILITYGDIDIDRGVLQGQIVARQDSYAERSLLGWGRSRRRRRVARERSDRQGGVAVNVTHALL